MQKTLPLAQGPSRPPPPPSKGVALQKAVHAWLQNRPRATVDEIKQSHAQNAATELAEALVALKRLGRITIVEEDGVPQFVGAKCEMCKALNGFFPTCAKKHPPPKGGWACREYERRVQKQLSRETQDREQPDDGNQLFERLMGR